MAKRSSREKSSRVTRDKVPRALFSRLGSQPDAVLAEEFGIPVEEVRRQRYLRGISTSNLVWDDELLALLGTASDQKIANRLGVPQATVKRQRRSRGIAPFGETTAEKKHHWTKRQLAWLGKLSDQEIANRLGLSQTTVGTKRVSLGIEPVKKGRPPRCWTKRELALLGKLSDSEVGRRLGIHRRKVALKRQGLGLPNPTEAESQSRWTPHVINKLGKVSDRQVADELGISAATVTAYRFRHRIAARNPHSQRGRPKGGGFRWTPDLVKRLGTVPDSQLADELEVTRQAVAQIRKRLGITAFSKRPES